MMVHVVHVLHSLGVGGTENGTVNLINQMMDGEFRHDVVCMTEAGPLAARLQGAQVHALHKRPGLDIGAVLRLVALLRRLRPSLVHTRNWGTIDAVLAARVAGVRAIVHGEHGREVTDPQGLNRRRNRLRRVLSPCIDQFVAVSFELRQWLVETVGISAQRVLTIHNGVDTERFAGARPDAPVPGSPAATAPTVVIGTVGRLDPVKDHAGLLRAFFALAATNASCRLHVVGDGPCRQTLEAEVRRLGLTDRVQLFGERADVPALLRSFDVYVQPSIAEGISNTILEAMATGLPVVATRTGGNPELVENQVTGRLVPVGEHMVLADTLAVYAADPELRRRHGKAGRERALNHFRLDQMVGAYRQLYRALAPGKAGSRRVSA